MEHFVSGEETFRLRGRNGLFLPEKQFTTTEALIPKDRGCNFFSKVILVSLSLLYDRQTDTIYLLIDVERIDVGHTADVVEYSHDTLF